MNPPPRRKNPPPAAAAAAPPAEQFSMKHLAAGAGGGGGRKGSNLPTLVVVFSIFLFVCFMYNEDVKSIAEFPFTSSKPPKPTTTTTSQEEIPHQLSNPTPIISQNNTTNYDPKSKKNKKEKKGIEMGCDLYTGQWVYDDVLYPLYKEEECEYMTEQVTCKRNGRRDDMYQKWRWQPRYCSLPRFDARLLLEKLRGKRMMFVGDSLNRNQWESMICLVQSVVPPGRKSLHKNVGSRNILVLEDYNATVEFYWSPFLVESNSDNPKLHSIIDRIIMPESITKHGVHWKGVDFLIFNTYIWWMNTSKMKVLRGSFDEGSTEYDEIERPVAYERVLRTWAKWVEENVDPQRTSVFFMSTSPVHIKSADWNNPEGIRCANETTPVQNTTAPPPDVGTDRRMLAAAEEVVGSMGVPASFINITAMSEYRKDGHTSVYTIRQGKLLTPEEKSDPDTYADCIHWCLPGLPDTWNELLYARIMSTSHV